MHFCRTTLIRSRQLGKETVCPTIRHKFYFICIYHALIPHCLIYFSILLSLYTQYYYFNFFHKQYCFRCRREFRQVLLATPLFASSNPCLSVSVCLSVTRSLQSTDAINSAIRSCAHVSSIATTHTAHQLTLAQLIASMQQTSSVRRMHLSQYHHTAQCAGGLTQIERILLRHADDGYSPAITCCCRCKTAACEPYIRHYCVIAT